MNDDKELVRKTLKGSSEAFEVIVRKHQQPLFNYIARTVSDKELALDLTQEVLLKAYSALKSYKPRFHFSTWLYKIASNTIIDHWRKKKVPLVSYDRPEFEGEDSLSAQIPDEGPSILTLLEMSELRDRIEEAIARLPAPMRELFVLRHVSGFSYEEMAEIKKQPVGTIKNRVFQAKEMVRKYLEVQPCRA